MAGIKLALDAKPYECVPCSNKQGTPVTELVRMIPEAVVLFGKLIGQECWCCPICFDPKFDVKTKMEIKPKRVAKPKLVRKPRFHVFE